VFDRSSISSHPLPRLLSASAALLGLFGLACQDVGITQQPEREGDDPGECEDAADNDGDGLFDCDDPDCEQAPVCLPNSPPVGAEVRIEPWVPTTIDSLACVVDVPAVDADGDEITYAYRWEMDGEDAGEEAPVPSSETSKHEVWTCFLTPSDALASGPTVTASVTIDNTAPTQPTVRIQPGSPTVDSNLQCTVTVDSEDADGDPVTYTYGWELNGSSTGRTDTNVPANNTENGQEWKCIVTPHDDEEEGATGSNTVDIHFDVVPHVTAGRWHSCSVGFDGTFECWGILSGGNNEGQVDDMPAEAFGIVSVGEKHSCGMTLFGTIRCWGYDANNQGSDPFGTFSALGTGYNHACGIVNTEEVSCWGTANNWPSSAPSGPWKSVTSGDEFACARSESGSVSCWNGMSSPTGSFNQIDAGGDHVCGVRNNGSILCWGSDSDGQVSGSPEGNSWQHVSAGDTHSCAVGGDDRNVTCWGNSANGRLSAPGGSFEMVDAGWNHTCGMRDNGQVACWGCTGQDQGQCNP
jgi:hypothetical protein